MEQSRRKLLNNELGRPSAASFREMPKLKIVVVLDLIRSGLNVGSVFRSADAFGVEKIVCCGYTPCPPHREVLKSALGATETVAWQHVEHTSEALQHLKNEGYALFAVEQTVGSVALDQWQPLADRPVALVFGNEVNGVSQEAIDLCDGTIEIQQFGSKHSLNIAVAAGITLYAASLKLGPQRAE